MTEKMPMMKRFVTTLEFEEQCEYVSFLTKGNHAYQISRLSCNIILTSWVMGYFCVATSILIVRFQLYPAGIFGALFYLIRGDKDIGEFGFGLEYQTFHNGCKLQV